MEIAPITHIVIQSGYCVFGAGQSYYEAIADAAKWMEDENGRQGGLSADEVRNLLVNRPVDGQFSMLTADDADFDSYLENQGGFTKVNGIWYAKG